jgi:hypothetical protein
MDVGTSPEYPDWAMMCSSSWTRGRPGRLASHLGVLMLLAAFAVANSALRTAAQRRLSQVRAVARVAQRELLREVPATIAAEPGAQGPAIFLLAGHRAGAGPVGRDPYVGRPVRSLSCCLPVACPLPSSWYIISVTYRCADGTTGSSRPRAGSWSSPAPAS